MKNKNWHLSFIVIAGGIIGISGAAIAGADIVGAAIAGAAIVGAAIFGAAIVAVLLKKSKSHISPLFIFSI